MAYKPILAEASPQDTTTLGGGLKSLAGQMGSGIWNMGAKAVTGIANAVSDSTANADPYPVADPTPNLPAIKSASTTSAPNSGSLLLDPGARKAVRNGINSVVNYNGIGQTPGNFDVGASAPDDSEYQANRAAFAQNGTDPATSVTLSGYAEPKPIGRPSVDASAPSTGGALGGGLDPRGGYVNNPAPSARAATHTRKVSGISAAPMAGNPEDPPQGYGMDTSPISTDPGPMITEQSDASGVLPASQVAQIGGPIGTADGTNGGLGLTANADGTVDKLFTLRQRTAAENAISPIKAQPVQAAAAAPTTTYGDSNGVYQLAPGQNPPPDFANMTAGQMVASHQQQKWAANNAGIGLTNAQAQHQGADIAHMGNQDAVSTFLAPYQAGEMGSGANLKNVTAGSITAKTPAEVKDLEAHTANINSMSQHYDALTKTEDALRAGKASNTLSEIDYRTQMLDIAKQKNEILRGRVNALIARSQKGDETDFHGISTSILEAMKVLQEKAKLSGTGIMTPEDEQMYKNYRDYYNKMFWRQKKTAYIPGQGTVQPISADAGDE